MESYGKLLKGLIQFTGSKLSFVAEAVGYDDSYISKWCNKSKLPAQKVASEVNRNLAAFFAEAILEHDDLSTYQRMYDKTAATDTLERSLYQLMKKSYNETSADMETQQKKLTDYQPRLLTVSNEIYNFFYRELAEAVASYTDPVDIYCTFDACQFFKGAFTALGTLHNPQHPIKIHMGLNVSDLKADSYEHLKSLYYFINKYSEIFFDFYDDRFMSQMNTMLIPGRMAILCSLDQYSRIQTAVIITDPDKVREIYQNIHPAFKITHMLIHATEADEFYMNGYRTEFYAQNSYQIFLARGFEYLLPPECFDTIEVQARDVMHDETLARIVPKLKITWEEIFEHGTIDFFTLKSTLMKYIEDGEIIFADVVYYMSVEERKKHIDNVLRIINQNPNIHFYVIDDEYIPNAAELIHTSAFSNCKKIFLKNPERYHTDKGPFFYSILSEDLIKEIGSFYENLKTKSCCYTYDADGVQRFVDKYGSMVYRILSLSDLK